MCYVFFCVICGCFVEVVDDVCVVYVVVVVDEYVCVVGIVYVGECFDWCDFVDVVFGCDDVGEGDCVVVGVGELVCVVYVDVWVGVMFLVVLMLEFLVWCGC